MAILFNRNDSRTSLAYSFEDDAFDTLCGRAVGYVPQADVLGRQTISERVEAFFNKIVSNEQLGQQAQPRLAGAINTRGHWVVLIYDRRDGLYVFDTQANANSDTYKNNRAHLPERVQLNSEIEKQKRNKNLNVPVIQNTKSVQVNNICGPLSIAAIQLALEEPRKSFAELNHIFNGVWQQPLGSAGANAELVLRGYYALLERVSPNFNAGIEQHIRAAEIARIATDLEKLIDETGYQNSQAFPANQFPSPEIIRGLIAAARASIEFDNIPNAPPGSALPTSPQHHGLQPGALDGSQQPLTAEQQRAQRAAAAEQRAANAASRGRPATDAAPAPEIPQANNSFDLRYEPYGENPQTIQFENQKSQGQDGAWPFVKFDGDNNWYQLIHNPRGRNPVLRRHFDKNTGAWIEEIPEFTAQGMRWTLPATAIAGSNRAPIDRAMGSWNAIATGEIWQATGVLLNIQYNNGELSEESQNQLRALHEILNNQSPAILEALVLATKLAPAFVSGVLQQLIFKLDISANDIKQFSSQTALFNHLGQVNSNESKLAQDKLIAYRQKFIGALNALKQACEGPDRFIDALICLTEPQPHDPEIINNPHYQTLRQLFILEEIANNPDYSALSNLYLTGGTSEGGSFCVGDIYQANHDFITQIIKNYDSSYEPDDDYEQLRRDPHWNLRPGLKELLVQDAKERAQRLDQFIAGTLPINEEMLRRLEQDIRLYHAAVNSVTSAALPQKTQLLFTQLQSLEQSKQSQGQPVTGWPLSNEADSVARFSESLINKFVAERQRFDATNPIQAALARAQRLNWLLAVNPNSINFSTNDQWLNARNDLTKDIEVFSNILRAQNNADIASDSIALFQQLSAHTHLSGGLPIFWPDINDRASIIDFTSLLYRQLDNLSKSHEPALNTQATQYADLIHKIVTGGPLSAEEIAILNDQSQLDKIEKFFTDIDNRISKNSFSDPFNALIFQKLVSLQPGFWLQADKTGINRYLWPLEKHSKSEMTVCHNKLETLTTWSQSTKGLLYRLLFSKLVDINNNYYGLGVLKRNCETRDDYITCLKALLRQEALPLNDADEELKEAYGYVQELLDEAKVKANDYFAGKLPVKDVIQYVHEFLTAEIRKHEPGFSISRDLNNSIADSPAGRTTHERVAEVYRKIAPVFFQKTPEQLNEIEWQNLKTGLKILKKEVAFIANLEIGYFRGLERGVLENEIAYWRYQVKKKEKPLLSGAEPSRLRPPIQQANDSNNATSSTNPTPPAATINQNPTSTSRTKFFDDEQTLKQKITDAAKGWVTMPGEKPYQVNVTTQNKGMDNYYQVTLERNGKVETEVHVDRNDGSVALRDGGSFDLALKVYDLCNGPQEVVISARNSEDLKKFIEAARKAKKTVVRGEIINDKDEVTQTFNYKQQRTNPPAPPVSSPPISATSSTSPRT